MFNTKLGAPVSKIKLPLVVSALACIKIKFPARRNGMMHEAESLDATGSAFVRREKLLKEILAAVPSSPCVAIDTLTASNEASNKIIIVKMAGRKFGNTTFD